jgi:hypothetical protein
MLGKLSTVDWLIKSTAIPFRVETWRIGPVEAVEAIEAEFCNTVISL